MLITQLREREARNRPVRVGLIGCGEMGTDIVTQIGLMPAMRLTAIADKRLSNVKNALAIAGLPEERGVEATSTARVDQIAEKDRIALVEDGDLITGAGLVDVIIEATGNPGAGARNALGAIENGKHVVMMNVEADITVGAWLARRASRAGVVYTLGAGDEPSAVMELMHFARTLGYPVVAAGKGKNNPLNFDAVPQDYAREAEQRGMNARMLTEFVDGSKTMIEMTAVANATGLTPDKPGMHGPNAGLDTLPQVLCPQADGGILRKEGVVDYTVGGGVAPGVFVIIKAPHARIDERLRDLKVGQGPYYALVRPYHLTSLEVPLSAAHAVLNNQGHMVPLPTPVADTLALAKRDLAPGVILGRIGEQDYRGWIMERGEAQAASALPIGLCEGARITRP